MSGWIITLNVLTAACCVAWITIASRLIRRLLVNDRETRRDLEELHARIVVLELEALARTRN